MDKIKLLNAITYALREMEKCPNDSVQDIWNESLKSWGTGLRMNHRFEIDDDEVFIGLTDKPKSSPEWGRFFPDP